jgi:hypothetical protein
MAINLTGLLQGFQQGNQFVEQQRAAKRAEEQFKLAGEQFKLTERKQRGLELDTKFKEARRVAELDAADEDATLKSLMQPGMDEGSRQAILASRNRRRTENEAYLKSMTADPEMSQELSTRFGDVTKLMKPSSIQSGMLPKPSMDIAQLIKMAEGYRKEAELTPDAESKGFLVQRGRDALSAIGASQQIIDKFLPGYKSVVGKGTETASPLTAVMEPEALRAKGLGAGSTFVDPQTGQTVRLTEQDGKLMKSYVTPAKDITAEYMPSGIEGAKVKKIYADIDRTEAAIKDIDSKIKMRPEEMKLKTQQVFAKISNDQLRAKIAKESLGIRYAGLALRRDLAELAREDAKRKLGINTSFRMADFNRKIQATAAANVGRAEASLLNAKKTLAQATTEGKPNERQAAQEAINFLEGEVATLRRAASGGIDYSGFKQSMDSIGLGDVDIDMSMFGSTSPMQSYGYQGYPQQQQAPVIVVPGGGAPAPYPYPYPPSPYPAPAPVPAPGGGTTAGSAVFRLSDGSAIPIGPDGFRVGQQPGQVSNKANALVKMMSGGKK